MKLLEVLNKENNKTAYLEELEKIKKADPESVDVYDLEHPGIIQKRKIPGM